ncbi:MAG: hypothetical protein AAFR37_24960, partial [Cyanobacteria bacterium J06628_3]
GFETASATLRKDVSMSVGSEKLELLSTESETSFLKVAEAASNPKQQGNTKVPTTNFQSILSEFSSLLSKLTSA